VSNRAKGITKSRLIPIRSPWFDTESFGRDGLEDFGSFLSKIVFAGRRSKGLSLCVRGILAGSDLSSSFSGRSKGFVPSWEKVIDPRQIIKEKITKIRLNISYKLTQF